MQQTIRSDIRPRSAAADSMGRDAMAADPAGLVEALWRVGMVVVFVLAMCWACAAIVSASPDPEGLAAAMSAD